MTDAKAFSLADALLMTPSPGSLAVDIFKPDSIDLEFYAPRGQDLQQAHSRDELYFIGRGTGLLTIGDVDLPCAAGDVLFVPARTKHSFTSFSADFCTWVIFYGEAVMDN